MGKLIILTGAPESDQLDWDTPDLLHTFLEPIARFAQLQPQTGSPPPEPTAQQQQHQQGERGPQDRSVLDLAVWRSLPLRRTHVPTGFSQQHDLHFVRHFPSSADFLTTASIASEAASQGQSQEDAGGEGCRLLAEFYEHSLALHDDDLAPSTRPAPQGSREGTSFASDDAGLSRTTASFASKEGEGEEEEEEEEEEDSTTTFLPADDAVAARTPLRSGPRGLDHHLSDLEDIPPASYLLSILPQTMTVTLIVGIISIAAPRTVETRYGTSKTLVEVLVGDETKSGFSVTFWLPGTGDESAGGGGGVLAGLRGQDVVLMQNVALNAFRGKVYGGSLRRDMTRVYLLYRGRKVDGEDVGGYYSGSDLRRAGREGDRQHPQLEKTRRVRDWVLKFVGGGPCVVDTRVPRTTRPRKAKERATRRDWNQPPPLDSQ